MYTAQPEPDAPLAPVRVRECESCGYVGLEHTVDPHILYGGDDHELTSRRMGPYLTQYVAWILENFPLSPGAKVLDIGCNDGYFLSIMREAGHDVLGMDIASKPIECARERGVPVLNGFIDDDWQGFGEDNSFHLITANRLWANVDNLGAFADNVKKLLHPDGYFIFETGYLPPILDNMLVETIYPEHISYDLLGPLVPFFQDHGLQVTEAWPSDVKGGSIRVVVKHEGTPMTMTVQHQLLAEQLWMTNDPWPAFEKRVNTSRDAVQFNLGAASNPCGYGAGMPGTALTFYLGLQDQLKWIVDDDPELWGKYMPGTDIEVRPLESLEESDFCIILAHRYAKEIQAKNKGFGGRWLIPFQSEDIKSSNLMAVN